MPADRSLIAELEQLLSRQPSDYQAAYGWLRRNHATLVAALEPACPPLGYMAVEDTAEPKSPTGRWIVPMTPVFPTAEECQPTLDLYKPLDGVKPARDARRFIAEAREMQP